MFKKLALLLVLIAPALSAQTVVPVLPDCRVASIQKNYADGDWRVTVRCEPNGTQKPVVGDRAQISRIVVTQVAPTITAFTASPSTITLGDSVTFTYAANGTPSPVLTIDNGVGVVTGTSKVFTPPTTGTFTFVLSANNGVLPVALRSLQVVVNPVTQPPTTGIVGGPVDPLILGNCTAAQHDAHVVTRNGKVYRTWHPQVHSSGCIYAHEHGDDPARLTDPTISLPMPAFGFIVEMTPGHPIEPHEGFKVFIENPGAVNDEGRVNRVYSRSVFHMGTGGPRRFVEPHHSADIYVSHPEFNLMAHTQLMMDTGGTGRVCDPRSQGPVKDVIALDFVQVCGIKLGSGYEIWSTQQGVYAPDGRQVYLAFATPAVFDPITVFNPANPTELVYIWDPRVTAIRQFNDDWTTNRGCERESYAQPGYWYNQGGPTTYYTNSMGQPVVANDPLALIQRISASNSIGAPATNDGLNAFKSRPLRWCGNKAQLRFKN